MLYSYRCVHFSSVSLLVYNPLELWSTSTSDMSSRSDANTLSRGLKRKRADLVLVQNTNIQPQSANLWENFRIIEENGELTDYCVCVHCNFDGVLRYKDSQKKSHFGKIIELQIIIA